MTTLRSALTRRLLWAMVLLLTAGAAAVRLLAGNYLTDQFDAALAAKAHSIAAAAEWDGDRLELEFTERLLDGFNASEGPDFFQFRSASGVSLARSRSLGQRDLPPQHAPRQTPFFQDLHLPAGPFVRVAGISFEPRLSGSAPLPETAAREVVLVVAADRGGLDGTLRTLTLFLAGCGAVLLAAIAFVVPRLLRRGLQPLQSLADETSRIDATNLSARFPATGLPGELVPITARLNELLTRLETSFERERRFGADVAHELRTPVAELRSMAELAVKLPDARTPHADQETLSIALHLESILTRLFALSRAEQSGQPVTLEPVAPAALADEICAAHGPLAAARGLQFHVRSVGTETIISDPVLLRSIISNLVENAVTYTPPGGTVEVISGPRAGTIEVRNTVEGLTPEDLTHLFDRFWRGDKARAGGDHAGLGLSVARSFARSLGGDVTAALNPPAELTMTLQLPVDA